MANREQERKIEEVVDTVASTLREALETFSKGDLDLSEVVEAIQENGWDINDLEIDIADVAICDVIDAHGFDDVVSECLSNDMEGVARLAAECDSETTLDAVIDSHFESNYDFLLDFYKGPRFTDATRERFREAIGAAQPVDEAALRAKIEVEVRAKVEAEIRERLVACLFPPATVKAE